MIYSEEVGDLNRIVYTIEIPFKKTAMMSGGGWGCLKGVWLTIRSHLATRAKARAKPGPEELEPGLRLGLDRVTCQPTRSRASHQG